MCGHADGIFPLLESSVVPECRGTAVIITRKLRAYHKTYYGFLQHTTEINVRPSAISGLARALTFGKKDIEFLLSYGEEVFYH